MSEKDTTEFRFGNDTIGWKYTPGELELNLPDELSYGEFEEMFKKYQDRGLDFIHEETDLWLEEPYRLFRNYTVYYFMKLFQEKEGIKNDWFKENTGRSN